MAASQTNTRIYRVTNGKTEHLVRANSMSTPSHMEEDDNLSGYDASEHYHWDHFYTLKQDTPQMRTSDMIQSKFLKKEDFDTATVLTIKNCSLEEVGSNGDERWVLWFNERTKGLILNKTKIRQLEGAYGEDTDNWTGKKARLSHDPTVMFGAEQVGGIKLETSKNGHTAPAKVQTAEQRRAAEVAKLASEFVEDQEVPF